MSDEAQPERRSVPVDELYGGAPAAPPVIDRAEERILDLDAIVPPTQWLRHEGIAYRLRSYFDLPGPILAQLFVLEDEAAESNRQGRDITDTQRKRVALALPDAPPHIVLSFTTRQLIQIINVAWEFSPRPPGPPTPSGDLAALEARVGMLERAIRRIETALARQSASAGGTP